jgi:hypothetical protein
MHGLLAIVAGGRITIPCPIVLFDTVHRTAWSVSRWKKGGLALLNA